MSQWRYNSWSLYLISHFLIEHLQVMFSFFKYICLFCILPQFPLPSPIPPLFPPSYLYFLCFSLGKGGSAMSVKKTWHIKFQ